RSAVLEQLARVREAFPAVDRFGEVLRRREVPFVPQTSVADCGAACLAMVLAFHGREERLEQLRDAMGIGRGGASAQTILRTAALYELGGRGVRVDLKAPAPLPIATILHWNMTHFVVFERLEGDDVVVIDPGFGRRAVPLEEARTSLTGVA